MDGRGWLDIAEFGQSQSKGNGKFCIKEECSNSSFSSKSHYVLDDFGNDGNRTIDKLAVSLSQEEESSSSATGFASNKICYITIHSEDYAVNLKRD